MYNFLINIDEETYNLYLYNIQIFLKEMSTNKNNEFSVDYFTNTIIDQIKKDTLNNVK